MIASRIHTRESSKQKLPECFLNPIDDPPITFNGTLKDVLHPVKFIIDETMEEEALMSKW
jgi:hypothetical protein